MADPLTLGLAAVSAAGSIAQGNSQAALANYNAQISERDGVIAKQEAQYAEQRQRDRTSRVLAAQRAATGAQGTTAEGSPLLVLADTAAELELDALAIQRSGDINQLRAREQAAIERAQGRQARTAGYFKAGASLIKGASQTSYFQDL